ncbi:chemotaxis protein CheA [Candidatus Contubernalis alkaliaceticus]|uniref:chemotaxis protein CheA n=1 Tax=Candidatus Contubernalis alkaliaceticus TaxID=338645 RepID=UPI001F4BE865|nr:chemotaxis protein CheA [Candidatus Contubernalis alkalaceticus]UNC91776.1 chemotaxis protein CheA [Candidatus Contubernalis alkalaceticus]
MDFSEYKDIYLAEAQEHLQSLNDALLKLENEPENNELIQEIFRSAHSLKGMSATMGYDDIAGLTHEMENALNLLREGTINLSKEFADILFKSLDALEGLSNRVENPELPPVDTSDLLEGLRRLVEGEEEEEVSSIKENFSLRLDEFEKEIVKEVRGKEDKIYYIAVSLTEDCLLKSVRAYMVIKVLENNGVVLKVKPPVTDLEDDNFDKDFFVLCQSSTDAAVIKAELLNILEIEKVEIEEYTEEVVNSVDSDSPPADVPVEQLEKINTSSDNVKASLLEQQPKIQSTKRSEKTIRVETEKLDQLINLVGELVINRTRIVDVAKRNENGEIIGAAEHLNRITTDLQSAVMKLRMVPVKQVFDRFPRMIRDLSLERGKKIRFEISGEETELDRSIVNQIGDPLVHLLRNAVDHGIESEEERQKAGKPKEGLVKLEARHEGSYVAIQVSDDGSGLDEKKLISIAVAKGIISSEEAEHYKKEDAYKLIFKNGFSTVKEVTDVSGRGVGMDAVSKIVESLSGLIDVQAKPGQGTSFTIRMPLTLAIIRALLVKAAGDIYAIPIETINESLYITEKEIKTIQKQEVISLRKEVLPLVSLQEQLRGLTCKRPEEIPVVIVTAGDKKAGLIVDDLLEQQEIVIKSLSRILGEIKGVAGATVLGNGKVAFILNISTLI